jgi:ribosomal protein S18 acetylase RimI-like enzyme
MQVRRVGVGDVETVRALRLHALLDAPEAFGSTYEREVAFPRSVWAERLSTPGNATLICEADGDSCGMVTVVRDDKDSQLAWLVGMWIVPTARGTGGADLLVTAALRWAEQDCLTTVRLHITDGNDHAERLYRRHGFNPTGRSVAGSREGVTEVEMEYS